MHECVFNTVEYVILPAEILQSLEHERKPWDSLKCYIDENKLIVYQDLKQFCNHLEHHYLKIGSTINVVKT